VRSSPVAREVLAAEQTTGQGSRRGGGGEAEAPLHLGPPLPVRLAQVIGDRVRAIESVAGQALFEEEFSRLVAKHDVMLGRNLTHLDSIEHQTFPSATCWRSMLSKSARKLPAPKPWSPFRWMISKKKGPPRTSLKSAAPSFMKICRRYERSWSPSTRISRSRRTSMSSSIWLIPILRMRSGKAS